MKVPRTERRSSQSILKEINHEYSLEGLMLKLQYFGHLMQRADSLEGLMLKLQYFGHLTQRADSLEGLMLKLQYFGHLMQRADSLEKTLMLGETEGRKRA